MKDFIKKNFVLLVAFALPVLLIAGVALSTYLPSLFLSTQYNFIYTACSDGTSNYLYYCNNYLQKLYSVPNGKIVENSLPASTSDANGDGVPDGENYRARIFLHDTQKNESREITLAEAKTLTLNNLLTSPDGVTVSNNYSYGGGDIFFLFGGGRSSYGYYLTKGKSKKKLNLINTSDQYYYQNNFQFLGWVLPGRNSK